MIAFLQYEPLILSCLPYQLTVCVLYYQLRVSIHYQLTVSVHYQLTVCVHFSYRTDLVIDAEVQTFKHRKLDILKLPIKRSFENIELDPALAASVVPTEVNHRTVLHLLLPGTGTVF